MTESSTPLVVETAYFEAHRQEWLADHEGEWAVVRGEELIGFFPSVGEGFEAGTREFGNVPFMVKCVVVEDKPEIIQRVHC